MKANTWYPSTNAHY